jgi:hypothetical protein
MLLQGLGCAIGIEGILTKAIDLLGLVRTEYGQSFRVRGVQSFPKLRERLPELLREWKAASPSSVFLTRILTAVL